MKKEYTFLNVKLPTHKNKLKFNKDFKLDLKIAKNDKTIIFDYWVKIK